MTLFLCLLAVEGNAQPEKVGLAQEETDPVSSGARLIEEGRFQEAIPLLETALSTFPDHPEIHFWLGIAYFKLGETSQAEKAFKQATLLNPNHFKAYYNLGAVYFKQEKWKKAAQAFLIASNLNPDQKAHLFLNIGLSYYKQGKVKDSVLWFNRTLEENPSPSTERNARSMLSLLSPEKASAEESKWSLGASIGREYDTNVLLSPADQEFTSKIEDWATIGNMSLGHTLPFQNRLRLHTKLKFFGRWYDANSDFNYHQHEAQVGLEGSKIKFRPNVSYSYIYTLFGNRPFLSFHRISFYSNMFQTGKHGFYLIGSWHWANDLDAKYDYLSGSKWSIGLSELSFFFKNRGYVRPSVFYSWVDSKDAVRDSRFSCRFCSYSYQSIEPSIQFLIPLFKKFKTKGFFQYQHRLYQDDEVWAINASKTGRKRRRDDRFTFSVSVLRSILKTLEAEMKYLGQVNSSNLGDDPQDYFDRDYTKHAFSVNVTLKF